MYRLRDRSHTPPKGFVWIDPITTQMVEARNYTNWIDAAISCRVGNRNALPNEWEMEDQLCLRYDPTTRKQICDYVEGDVIVPQYGVGGMLKSILAGMGIHSCWGCIDTAAQMDAWGPDGCEEHMGEIVSAMSERARQKNWMRFVPFKEMGAEALVRLSIARVRARD